MVSITTITIITTMANMMRMKCLIPSALKPSTITARKTLRMPCRVLATISCVPKALSRTRGIVPDKDGGWLFFDYVPGDTDIRKGSPAYTGLITVIGEKVDVELMKKLFGVK